MFMSAEVPSDMGFDSVMGLPKAVSADLAWPLEGRGRRGWVREEVGEW